MFKEIAAPQVHIETKRKEKVCGVGTNDAPYYTSLEVDGMTCYCPYYTRWKKMLNSCYSVKNGSGALRSVCEEWQSFMGFRKWMEQQSWEGNELTHWLRVPGSTTYSPASCLFVSKRVRSLFPSVRSKEGRPIGVKKARGRYVVSCYSIDRRYSYVGSYETLNEAVEAYVLAKEDEAKSVAYSQKDPLVTQAVLDYMSYFSTQQRALKTI